MAVTMRMLSSFYIPLFGEAGMRVGISGIFSAMPAILFGPVWGAIASGATDVLGHFMRPTGAYLPAMTLAHVSSGFLRGLLWLLLRKCDPKKIHLAVLIFSFCLLVFGGVNWVILRLDGITPEFFTYHYYGEADTSGMLFISRLIISRSQIASNPATMLNTMITTTTRASIAAGVLGLLLYGTDVLMSAALKKDYKEYTSIMPLLISMLVAGWWLNTFNTIILRNMQWAGWQHLPFGVVWLPRIIQNTIVTIVYTYFVAFLLGVCKRQKYLRAYLR